MFDPCTTLIPWRTRFPNLMSLGFPKDSPFFPFVNHQLLGMAEGGRIGYIYKKWVPQVRRLLCFNI